MKKFLNSVFVAIALMTGTSLSATTNETTQTDAVEQSNAKRCVKTTTVLTEVDDDGRETIVTETHERCVETN